MNKPVETLEQYYWMVNEAKQKWGRLQNNAYFLPEFLEAQIRQGKLFSQFTEYALLFFLERAQYVQLYFYAPKPIGELQTLQKKYQKPLLASLIGTVPPETLAISSRMDFLPDERIPAKLKDSCALFQALMLKRADCYYHMSAPRIAKPAARAFLDFSFLPARKEQIPEIMSLLSNSFPLLTSDLPEKQDFESLIEQNEAFLLTDPSRRICGYCQYEAQKNKRMLRHLVIAPEFRGKHLSDYILQCLSERFSQNPSFLWVKSDNAAAGHLYETWGYRFDGRVLFNYTLEPSN